MWNLPLLSKARDRTEHGWNAILTCAFVDKQTYPNAIGDGRIAVPMVGGMVASAGLTLMAVPEVYAVARAGGAAYCQTTVL